MSREFGEKASTPSARANTDVILQLAFDEAEAAGSYTALQFAESFEKPGAGSAAKGLRSAKRISVLAN